MLNLSSFDQSLNLFFFTKTKLGQDMRLVGQALLGVFLFHTLFIVASAAGREIIGDAQAGEYFRVFVAYGVIGVTLAMHAWKTRLQSMQKIKDLKEKEDLAG